MKNRMSILKEERKKKEEVNLCPDVHTTLCPQRPSHKVVTSKKHITPSTLPYVHTTLCPQRPSRYLYNKPGSGFTSPLRYRILALSSLNADSTVTASSF